jgi:hypothetical protein
MKIPSLATAAALLLLSCGSQRVTEAQAVVSPESTSPRAPAVPLQATLASPEAPEPGARLAPPPQRSPGDYWSTQPVGTPDFHVIRPGASPER